MSDPKLKYSDLGFQIEDFFKARNEKLISATLVVMIQDKDGNKKMQTFVANVPGESE